MMTLLIPLFVEVAHAAVTGGVRGHVEDEDGLAIPNAIVTLTGKEIAGQLSTTTDGDGNFRFPSVPVGTHTVQVSQAGMAPLKTTVTVRLDETVFIPVTLKLNATEEIEVVSVMPVIDSTRSAFSTELSEEVMDNLPTGRSYQDAVNMLPGVYGRVDSSEGGPGDGNPSVRGEGQYGNNFFMDGISTRDPATKTFGTNVPFDAIQDIQVYTDGAPAEYGQATGMIVNVVTKDGGDEHFGSVYYGMSMDASFSKTYLIVDFEAGEEVETEKRDFMSHELSLTAGGPIVKEKLWYFAGLTLGYSSYDYEGGDHTKSIVSGIDGFGKLTWFASSALSLQYQIAGSASNLPNYETSPLYSAESQALYQSGDFNHLVTLRWHPDAMTELQIKGLWSNSFIDVVPSSGDEETPQYVTANGQVLGNYDSFDYNDRARMGVTASLTHLLSGTSGDHKVKLGVEQWRLTDTRELVYTGPDGGVKYSGYVDEESGINRPCVEPDHSDCYQYTEYSEVGPLGHTGDIFTGYLQDDWQPVDPLTLNLGVRADHEALYQNAGDPVFSAWMLQPRFGLAWDMTRDSKTVFTMNAGRYYDLEGNTFADWGDTRSAFSYREYTYDPGSDDYYLSWVQDPAGNPASYDENLVPYHMDKLALGIKRELFPLFAVGVRGILSKTSGLSEDVDIDGSTFIITNPDAKVRDYRAVELTAEKKFDERWLLLASYTLSESKGHTPGQFEVSTGGEYGSDGNQVGVYLDDVNDMETRAEYFDSGYGWLLEGLAGLGTETDDAGYYGYLPYHSFHQLKINGAYTWQVKKFDLTSGLIYEFDSGHAWQKRGFVSLYGDYYAFPEGRGSRFMPAVNYIDLKLAAEYDMGNDRSVELGLQIFNLPDFITPVSYVENDTDTFGMTFYRQAPRSIEASLQFIY